MPPRVTRAQAANGRTQFHDALAFREDPGEAIGVDIVETEKVLHTVQPAVRSADAMRLLPARPRAAAHRLQLEWSPLVEADDRRARRAAPVERADAVFF